MYIYNGRRRRRRKQKQKMRYTHTRQKRTRRIRKLRVRMANGGFSVCHIHFFFLSTTKYQEKKMETSGPHGLKMPTTVSNDDILFSYKRERNKKKHKRNAAAALRRKYRPLYMLYNDRLSITLIIIIIIIIISLAVHFLPH